MNPEELAMRYPAFRPLMAVPEIAKLIAGLQPGSTADTFKAALQGTDWWRNQSEAQRNWAGLELTEPGEVGARIREQFFNVADRAQAEGVHLSFETLGKLAHDSLANAWDSSEILRRIFTYVHPNTMTPGDLKASTDDLRATANQYAVGVSNNTLFDWAKRIAIGSADANGFESYARGLAKTMYPTLRKELDAGITVKQIADPYLQVAQQTLGVNPETLNLTDPKWQKALQSRDAHGQLQGPMDMATWQTTLTTDPHYGYDRTQNAKNDAFALQQGLAKTMGKVA